MAGGDKKKIILVIVLFLVAGGIFWYFNWRRPVMSDSVRFVDVQTGETIWIGRNEMPSILPAKNPKTGTKTLLPVEERDGKFYVRERFRDVLPELAKENRYVDPKTFEIRPPQ